LFYKESMQKLIMMINSISSKLSLEQTLMVWATDLRPKTLSLGSITNYTSCGG
jgi:hypothetical protein